MAQTCEVAFEALYLRLRQEGFRTGVDQQLRMQELLDLIACEPQDLKTVLCPLFATNATQQAIFYRVFDEVFPLLAADTPSPAQLAAAQALHPTGVTTPARKQERPHPRYLKWLLIFGLLVAGALLYSSFHRSTPASKVEPKPPPPPSTTPPVRRRTLNLALPAGVPTLHPEAKLIAYEWGAIVTPLLFFGGFALYRYFRRQISGRREAELQPPHFWPLQLESLGARVFRADDIRELARRLRQREDAMQSNLDIPATVSATIKGHGFPNFRFRPIRRPPEYLVLIERVSNADPFSCMTTDLAGMLKADGVLLSCYHFEGDPRRLFTDSGDQLDMADLAPRTGDYRLLLFGSSGCLFHPVTGRLEDWVAPVFERYQLKSLLIADAPRPKRIGRLWDAGFAVLPADSAGLRQTVDFFESGGAPAGKAFPAFHPLPDPLTEDSLEPANRPEDLWLAACAVYPEINWNLALRVASTIDSSLLCEESASRIARNQWLRQGEIPAHEREQLAERIPEWLRPPLQQSLFALLSTQPVPQDTFAWENWQHTLRAFRLPERSWGSRFLDLFSRGPLTEAHESAQDLVCLRFLNQRPRGRFSFVLPGWLRSRIFEQGESVLGTRTVAWLPIAAIAMLVVALVLRPWQIPEGNLRHVAGTVVDGNGAYLNAAVNGVPATGGNFAVDVAGNELPVTTALGYWPQSINMVEQGKVRVLVGQKNPRQGQVKILNVDFSRHQQYVTFTVDYSGPVTSATVDCVSAASGNSRVGSGDNVIQLPPMPLAPGISHDCNVVIAGGGSGSTSSGVFIPAVGGRPAAPESNELQALKGYKVGIYYTEGDKQTQARAVSLMAALSKAGGPANFALYGKPSAFFDDIVRRNVDTIRFEPAYESTQAQALASLLKRVDAGHNYTLDPVENRTPNFISIVFRNDVVSDVPAQTNIGALTNASPDLPAAADPLRNLQAANSSGIRPPANAPAKPREANPFAGTWVQTDAPKGTPPMRLDLTPNGSQLTLRLSYSEAKGTVVGNASVQGSGTTLVQGSVATLTIPQGCAQQFQKPGYSYDNPGSNVFTLTLKGSTLLFQHETRWTAPCANHPIGTERVEATLQRAKSQ